MGYMNDPRGLLLTTCPSSIDHYVQNLTSSYSNKSNESSVVATSVFMLVLAAVFFNLNLFSRVSNTSAVLNPTARAILNSALNLFLPVMSYLFSEAKNTPDGGADLPVRARLILTWMLLVELLRKKVEAILVTAGMQQGYSNIITHANAVAWLGYLVFFNLKVAGRVAVFGTLWLLCAAKFVQRVAFTEIGKRSLAYGKNARLLSSYMAEMVKDPRHGGTAAQDQDLSPSQRMKTCKYVVMGEENLMRKPGPHGYELDLDRLNTTYDDGDHIVTVGKIWELVEQEKKPRLKRLQRLSLSFALFKLLRPRFELRPAMTKQETDHCRDLIFQGLCRVDDGDVDPGVALFQVLKDEISFLSEYYHSVHPVVLASPYFFVINYITFPVVVMVLCFMTIALAGNGDMLLAFHSVGEDNYAISSGIFTLTKCLWKNFLRKPVAFFAIIDISITYLLFIAFVYEEVWEYMVFVFSNWFMVSLLCTHTARRRWQESKTYRGTLRCIAWISSKLSHPSRVTLKQFSVLRVSWLSMTLPTTSLPTQAKRSIMERFGSAAYGRDGLPGNTYYTPCSNGTHQRYSRLSWFCETESVAEVIITWHIATSLLETTYPGPRKGGTSPTDHHRAVATKLSKYCSYLVVFHPELLPDDRECTERVYEDMKTGLEEALGSWNYYLGPENAR
ncbi:uncharacterized protein LOC119284177 [Triticum dicoccoides]|uniref:uncharacterized protein LOC119284177 n=1 Tax=Triticum dicoccoides TaxID=85692 RepID=UPI0018900F0A|nr:uncharacterized protein LOC119284177 [Triticum dicoccoides]